MLNELQNIRRLLTSPTPENVRAANVELGKLPAATNDLSRLCLASEKLTREDVKSLMNLRSEVSSIVTLTAAALDYFRRVGLLRAAGFGDYERTGALKPIETASRTIGQL